MVQTLTAEEIAKKLHTMHLTVLNMYRFVQQSAFQRAYALADSKERTEADCYINGLHHSALNAWTRRILQKHQEYDYLDVRYLRELAQEKGYRGYSMMGRVELIAILINNQKEAHVGSNRSA